jgi:hypothetical protein
VIFGPAAGAAAVPAAAVAPKTPHAGLTSRASLTTRVRAHDGKQQVLKGAALCPARTVTLG